MTETFRTTVTRDKEGQIVRIPKELEVSETEMTVTKDDDALVLRPTKRKRSLSEVLASLEPIDEEFPEIDDPPPEPVEI